MTTRRRADLEHAIRIERDRLDDELIAQSEFAAQVGDMVAITQSDLDEAKSNLVHIEGELILQFRERTDKKIPVTQLKVYVHKDRSFRAALQEMQRLRRRARRWVALEKAFDQRSKMLRSLVQLYISDYYSMGQVRSARNIETTVRSERNKRELAERTRKDRDD